MPASEVLSELLFVCGSLRRDGTEAFRMEGAAFVGEGRAEGTLHLISSPPDAGLVPGSDRGWVTGELYRVSREHLRSLDQVVCETPSDGDGHRRVRIHVTLDGIPYDDTFYAWTYEWLGSAERSPEVPGGDWTNVARPPAAPVFTWSAWALLLLPLGVYLAQSFSANGGSEQWWMGFWVGTTVLILAAAFSMNLAARRRERMRKARIIGWFAITIGVVVQFLGGSVLQLD